MNRFAWSRYAIRFWCSSLGLLFLVTCDSGDAARAWGGDSSVSNMVEVLRIAGNIASDYGNEQSFIAPDNLFRIAVELTEGGHRQNGIYTATESLPNLVCNGEGTEVDLALTGSHNNFSIALPEKESRKHIAQTVKVPADEIFEKLFRRKGAMKAEDKFGLNFLWVTWVNFYFEDSLRTKPGTKGATKLDTSTSMNNLAMVYGRDKERENILRSFVSGKLRTSLSRNGEEIPLRWSDVAPGNVNKSQDWHIYVLGDDNLNMHWGHIFWHTIYLKEHNRICDALALENPSFTDDRLYRMARVIMTHRNARVFLENFASEVVLRANNIHTKILADIDFCAADEFADLRNRPVRLPLEYVHAYTFHELIPDEVEYGSEGGVKSLLDDIFKKPQDFSNQSLQSHLNAFYTTPAGTFSTENVPEFLKFVTIQQIEDSRSNQLGSYVAYNKFYGGRPIRSFEDLGHNAKTKEALAKVYDSVEDIEAYVGIQLEASFLTEDHDDDRPLVRTSLILGNVIPNFISTSCYKDTFLYSEEFLTRKGLDLISGPSDALVSLLENHVVLEDGTPFTRFNEQIQYRPLPGIHHFYLGNIADFVGINEMWHHAMRYTPEFQFMFVAVVTAAILYVSIMPFAVPVMRTYTINFMKRHPGPSASLKEQPISLLCHYAVFSFVLLVQIPVYTVVMVFLMFSERPDLAFEKFWFAGVFMAAIHLVLYIADIAVRSHLPWFLVAHHVMWLLFFLIPPLFRDIFTLKVGLVLDYFVVYETGIYWLMFWSKMNSRQLSPRARLMGQCAVYLFGATRIFQFIALLALFVPGYSRMKDFGNFGLYVFDVILTILVQLSQVQLMHTLLGWKHVFGDTGTQVRSDNSKTEHLDGDLKEVVLRSSQTSESVAVS